MPYTYTSLAFMWLVTLGLFGASASGLVAGSWVILLLVAALVTPALILERVKPAAIGAPQLNPVPAIAGSRRRPRPLSLSRMLDRSPLEAVGVDVDLWENEGGAPRRQVRRRL